MICPASATDSISCSLTLDLLGTLGVGSAHVVGVSIGAWIGAEIAAIRPEGCAVTHARQSPRPVV